MVQTGGFGAASNPSARRHFVCCIFLANKNNGSDESGGARKWRSLEHNSRSRKMFCSLSFFYPFISSADARRTSALWHRPGLAQVSHREDLLSTSAALWPP